MSEEKKEGMLPEENPSAPKKPEGFFTPLKQKKAESQWVSSDAPSAPKEEDNSQHTTETENHQVSSVEEKAPSAGPEQKSGNPQNPGVQGTASVQNRCV